MLQNGLSSVPGCLVSVRIVEALPTCLVGVTKIEEDNTLLVIWNLTLGQCVRHVNLNLTGVGLLGCKFGDHKLAVILKVGLKVHMYILTPGHDNGRDKIVPIKTYYIDDSFEDSSQVIVGECFVNDGVLIYVNATLICHWNLKNQKLLKSERINIPTILVSQNKVITQRNDKLVITNM